MHLTSCDNSLTFELSGDDHALNQNPETSPAVISLFLPPLRGAPMRSRFRLLPACWYHHPSPVVLGPSKRVYAVFVCVCRCSHKQMTRSLQVFPESKAFWFGGDFLAMERAQYLWTCSMTCKAVLINTRGCGWAQSS